LQKVMSAVMCVYARGIKWGCNAQSYM
jgi:hypothetical protein